MGKAVVGGDIILWDKETKGDLIYVEGKITEIDENGLVWWKAHNAGGKLIEDIIDWDVVANRSEPAYAIVGEPPYKSIELEVHFLGEEEGEKTVLSKTYVGKARFDKLRNDLWWIAFIDHRNGISVHTCKLKWDGYNDNDWWNRWSKNQKRRKCPECGRMYEIDFRMGDSDVYLINNTGEER